MTSPAVTVVMSAHNATAYLAEAVDSLLSQTFSDFELLVVEDGSTDSTRTLLQDYAARDLRIRVLANERNIGLTRSLNRALSEVRTPFVARQDADDLSHPDRLARQMEWFGENPQAVLLGTAYHVIDRTGTVAVTHAQPLHDTAIRWQMLFHNAFCHSSVMFRRQPSQIGALRYDQSLATAQDYDLWNRMLRFGRGGNLADALVSWRQHDQQISAAKAMQQRETADGIAAQLMARRLGHLPTPEAVRQLRDAYYRPAAELSPQDRALTPLWRQLLDGLGEDPWVDTDVLARLRRTWEAKFGGTSNVAPVLPFH